MFPFPSKTSLLWKAYFLLEPLLIVSYCPWKGPSATIFVIAKTTHIRSWNIEVQKTSINSASRVRFITLCSHCNRIFEYRIPNKCTNNIVRLMLEIVLSYYSTGFFSFFCCYCCRYFATFFARYAWCGIYQVSRYFVLSLIVSCQGTCIACEARTMVQSPNHDKINSQSDCSLLWYD